MRRNSALIRLLLMGLLALPVSPAHAAVTAAEYAAIRADIQADQAALQARWRAATTPKARAVVLVEARARTFEAIAHQLIPAWKGTTWEFYGTTQVPGRGAIACGYYVSTLLDHAGFEVERVKLAQQASERIIKSLTHEDHIWRSSDASVERSLEPLTTRGDGIWIAGLDYHVGLLVHEDGATRWCDSSYLHPTAVTCQRPGEAFSYSSRYRVIGQILTDPMLEAWLEGRALPTFTGTLR